MNDKHILIIHPTFCIRAQKQAEGLLNSFSSIKMTILCNTTYKRSGVNDRLYKDAKIIHYNFQKNFLNRLWYKFKLKFIIKDVDVIHCHNEPNYFILDTIKAVGNKIPVVYDIHDFTTMRNGNSSKLEEEVYTNSSAIIHVSNNFINYGNEKYGNKRSEVILSTPTKEYFIDKKVEFKKKDFYSFVYEGGTVDKKYCDSKKYNLFSYRDYYKIFSEILQEGHAVHLYTPTPKEELPTYLELEEDQKNFYIHDPLPYKQLIQEMYKYDIGLTGFNFDDIEEEHRLNYLNSAMGNKLFDYICASIPTIVVNAKEMSNFVLTNNCGITKNKDESWTEALNRIKINANNFSLIRDKFCMESQVDRLSKLYKLLM